MSGLHQVDCGGCGQRHATSDEQARSQRVLRCACGQFVRLDRALTELRSDPAPAQAAPAATSAEEDDEDEQTHMLQSLSAVAALRSRAAPRPPQPSLSGDERTSSPSRPSTLRSLSPAPMRRPTPVPGEKQTDKPLWYVDLGGSETLHMTIEQLIVARRSGKLGEGALVWREGMPRWRPVGTLIPATSITDRPPPPATAAPSPPIAPTRPAPPPAPSRQPAPSLSSEAAPQSFGSYERPAATLEFALEKAGSAPPREAARSPLPSKERASSPPARSLTPVPRPETWTASVANAKVPPPLALPAPVPARPAPLMPTTPSAPVSFASDRPTQPPVSAAARGEPGTRPRWVSVGIALLLCVTAASAGAFLVRSLKLRRQPPTLASSTLGPPLVNTSAATHAIPAASPAPANPVVVDLESLSLEHKAKRSTARPAAMPVRKPPVVPAEPSDDSSPPASDDPEAAPAPRQKPKNSDLPAAAQANPYTTGSDEPSL